MIELANKKSQERRLTRKAEQVCWICLSCLALIGRYSFKQSSEAQSGYLWVVGFSLLHNSRMTVCLYPCTEYQNMERNKQYTTRLKDCIVRTRPAGLLYPVEGGWRTCSGCLEPPTNPYRALAERTAMPVGWNEQMVAGHRSGGRKFCAGYGCLQGRAFKRVSIVAVLLTSTVCF